MVLRLFDSLHSKSISGCVVLSSLQVGAWLLWPFPESIAEHMEKLPFAFRSIVTVHVRGLFIKAIVLASDICIVPSVMTWPVNSTFRTQRQHLLGIQQCPRLLEFVKNCFQAVRMLPSRTSPYQYIVQVTQGRSPVKIAQCC